MAAVISKSGPVHRARRQRLGMTGSIEALGVLASPVICYFALRLRAMAPDPLPDPTLHSTFIFDPRDIFFRYAAVLSPSARMREGARVGFLVPARLAYLAFGAVPGFLVFRYLLCLIAVVPAYLLVKRLYGTGAGVLAIILIMSSPVLVTAWGTDYPDSATVSYLAGALCCLVMPAATRRARLGYVAIAGTLMTLSVWAFAASAPYVAVTALVWFAVRLVRARGGLAIEVGLLVATAVIVTVLLGVASYFELGLWDYIAPTVRAVLYLNTPVQERLWHSSSWRWAPYDSFLLVLPATLGAFAVTFVRRARIDTAALTIGVVAAVELCVAVYGQFFSHVQLLEYRFFSSGLWPASLLALVLVIAEVARRASPHTAGDGNRVASVRSEGVLALGAAALAVAVVLGIEIAPAVPAFGMAPIGIVLLAAIVLAAAVARSAARSTGSPVGKVLVLGGVAATLAASLVLTVAPRPVHQLPPGTVSDPATSYGTALGGSGADLVADYRLMAEARSVVPNATYRGEQLLTCWTIQTQLTLEVVSLFHGSPNLLPEHCPAIGAPSVARIEARRAAQLLVVSVRPMSLAPVMAALRPFHPVLVAHRLLRSGSQSCRLWLIDLDRYLLAKATSPPGLPG